MENRKKCRIIYLGIFLNIFYMFSSCNYIPCRGQDYLIKDITHKELISRFNELREKHPEYAAGEDYIDEYRPWRRFITLYWKDLDLRISLNIHTGDQIPNPPTHLNFTSTGKGDINSRDLNKRLNEQYKRKFEKEILDKLGVKWKRKICL